MCMFAPQKSQLKVLHAQNITGIAGSEMYLLNALPALKEAGIAIDFLCFYPSSKKKHYQEFASRMEQKGIRCHAIAFDFFPFVKCMRKLHQLVRKEKYDVLHSHLIHADFLFAYYKRILNPGIKLVSTKHGYQEWYNNKFGFDPGHKKNNFYLRVARFAEKQVNQSIAISKGLLKLYTGLRISSQDRIEHIPYGFDFSEITEQNPHFRRSKHQLVMVGRLTAFKGHRYAIEALSILRNHIPDIHLLLIGTGNEEPNLKKQVAELGLNEHIEFVGYSKEARNYMRNADLVLVPSVSEGFGVVVLEAFSVSKAIVAFDVPSLNEHIEDGVNGRLIEPYDVKAYAKVIHELLENDAILLEMGHQAFKKLKEFYTLQRMTSQTIKSYEKLF